MTNYAAVLKELMIAGYEGAHLLAAFDRLCTAIGGNMRTGRVVSAKSAIKSANEPTKKAVAASRPMPVRYPVPDGAKAIGRKALAASGLASSTIKVGSQLLEHCNLDTGRCDPGSRGIAERTGVALRTVQRAISDLVDAGLFTVAQNAGRAHANAYFPVWPRLMELADSVTVSQPVLAQTPDKSGDQNQRTKPDKPLVVGKAARVLRAARVDERQRQLPLMRKLDGGKASQPIVEAAREATRTRLFGELRDVVAAGHPGDKAVFVAIMTRAGSVDYGPIIAAEMARRGSGLALLLDTVGLASDGKARVG